MHENDKIKVFGVSFYNSNGESVGVAIFNTYFIKDKES